MPPGNGKSQADCSETLSTSYHPSESLFRCTFTPGLIQLVSMKCTYTEEEEGRTRATSFARKYPRMYFNRSSVRSFRNAVARAP